MLELWNFGSRHLSCTVLLQSTQSCCSPQFVLFCWLLFISRGTDTWYMHVSQYFCLSH